MLRKGHGGLYKAPTKETCTDGKSIPLESREMLSESSKVEVSQRDRFTYVGRLKCHIDKDIGIPTR